MFSHICVFCIDSAFMWCQNNWKENIFPTGKFMWTPPQVRAPTRKAETRQTKENTGLMVACMFVQYVTWRTWSGPFCSFLSLKCWKRLSMWWLNFLSDLNAKQLLFGIHVSPTFQPDTHEHTELGKMTSELWKWDHPRSPWLQHNANQVMFFESFVLLHSLVSCSYLEKGQKPCWNPKDFTQILVWMLFFI